MNDRTMVASQAQIVRPFGSVTFPHPTVRDPVHRAFKPSRLACVLALSLALVPPNLVVAGEAPQNGSFAIGPEYKIDPALTDLGAPKGRQFQFILPVGDKSIFRGDDSVLDPAQPLDLKKRQITVYVPAGYKDGRKAPVLVFFDGPGPPPTNNRFEMASYALDNLTASQDAARRLPAFVIVGVQAGGGNGAGSARNLEYSSMSDRNGQFIHDEVLPAVEANKEIKATYPHFALTRSADGRAAMGCSAGGAAALTLGWFRPEWFHRVIAYSAGLVDGQLAGTPEKDRFPLGAGEYHSGMELIRHSPRKPLRIFHHVSENDSGVNRADERQNSVIAGKRTAAALDAKGYDHRFIYSLGSKHCDARVFEQTLADTLVWIWQGFRQ